jgi:hypothetical protein
LGRSFTFGLSRHSTDIHHNETNKSSFNVEEENKCFLICESCCWIASTYSKSTLFSRAKQTSLCPLCNNKLHCFNLDTSVSKSSDVVANDFTKGHSDGSKAPKLKVVLVAILLRCTINGLDKSDIDVLIRNLTASFSSVYFPSLTKQTIKKYLYYLIEYDLILYDGTNQVFVIKNSGINLLSIIIATTKKCSLDIEKMSIEFE